MEFLYGPGFLGTNATIFSDLTLLAVLGVGALFTWGFYQVRRGKQVEHHFTQMLATVVIVIITSWLMILPFWGHIVKQSNSSMPGYFYLITTIHALVGLVAIGFGIFVILGTINVIPKVLPLQRYKPFMRVAYGLFMTAILTGIIVYITWYVILPTPPQ